MRVVALLAVSLVACLLLGGCAQHSSPAETAPTRVSDDVRIGLNEWNIETGPVRAASGDVRLQVTNAGATAHDLVVTGVLGSWATPVLAPGERYELRIRTASGEHLDLVCTLTGHHSQGMHTQLAVEGRP